MEESRPSLARGKRSLFLVTINVLKHELAVVCREYVEAWTRDQAEVEAKLAIARRWYTTDTAQLQTQSIFRGVFLHDTEIEALERKAYPMRAVDASSRSTPGKSTPGRELHRDDQAQTKLTHAIRRLDELRLEYLAYASASSALGDHDEGAYADAAKHLADLLRELDVDAGPTPGGSPNPAPE